MDRQLGAQELAAMLETGSPHLVDVREPDEVASWSIPGAVNVPLGELAARAGELPRDRRIVAFCASGRRSGRATEVLTRLGFDAADLRGGMATWARVYDTASFDVPGARIVQVRRRAKGCLSYLVGAGDEAFVVDPSLEVDRYLELAAAQGWRIRRVFDTHLHADHLSGARLLAESAGASLHLNPADRYAFAFTPVGDGDTFVLPGGGELSIAALHTPGHTEGSTAVLVGGAALLSGDTLFTDGVGRPDLAERAAEFARELYRSLHERVLSLPSEVTVLPSHFGATARLLPGVPLGAPLGRLRAELAPLALGEDGFVAWATTDLPERPPNYQTIVEANAGRRHLPAELAGSLEAGPNRCAA